MTTTSIATTARIETLRSEAARMGDAAQVDLCDVAAAYGDDLDTFARQTAADMGANYVAAIKAMRDDSGEVAANIGCSDAVVIAWVKCAAALVEGQG